VHRGGKKEGPTSFVAPSFENAKSKGKERFSCRVPAYKPAYIRAVGGGGVRGREGEEGKQAKKIPLFGPNSVGTKKRGDEALLFFFLSVGGGKKRGGGEEFSDLTFSLIISCAFRRKIKGKKGREKAGYYHHVSHSKCARGEKGK